MAVNHGYVRLAPTTLRPAFHIFHPGWTRGSEGLQDQTPTFSIQSVPRTLVCSDRTVTARHGGKEY